MIVLINPNSTVSMTEAMAKTARMAAPDCQIEGWTSHKGPPAIEGREDGTAAEAPLLDLVQEASSQGAACIIIGCFDDTALPQARRLARCPVIGIGQAAYHMAALAGDRFSVVTTLPVSVPILEENIRAYGLDHALVSVSASDVPVLDLERNPSGARDRIVQKVQDLVRHGDAGTIVLGCGGMVDVAASLDARSHPRMIDGVRAAAVIARGLIGASAN